SDRTLVYWDDVMRLAASVANALWSRLAAKAACDRPLRRVGANVGAAAVGIRTAHATHPCPAARRCRLGVLAPLESCLAAILGSPVRRNVVGNRFDKTSITGDPNDEHGQGRNFRGYSAPLAHADSRGSRDARGEHHYLRR